MKLPPHALATLAFREHCWRRSRAVFANDGKLGALRRILSDLPTFCC